MYRAGGSRKLFIETSAMTRSGRHYSCSVYIVTHDPGHHPFYDYKYQKPVSAICLPSCATAAANLLLRTTRLEKHVDTCHVLFSRDATSSPRRATSLGLSRCRPRLCVQVIIGVTRLRRERVPPSPPTSPMHQTETCPSLWTPGPACHPSVGAALPPCFLFLPASRRGLSHLYYQHYFFFFFSSFSSFLSDLPALIWRMLGNVFCERRVSR